MAEMLSPGVFIEEIDASTIVPSVSASVAVFGGEFVKGPTGAFMLISTVDDLIEFYGLPTDENYNQWFQAWNFLQYGNTLYLSRAINKDSVNATAEGNNLIVGGQAQFTLMEDDVLVGTPDDYEDQYNSITLEAQNSVIRFIARNPGNWGNSIELAIANPKDFNNGKEAFEGIDLDSLFEYYPDEDNNEVGIIIRNEGKIEEIYICSLNKDSRDSNNKSNYIENVLNRSSNLVFCKYPGDPTEGLASYIRSEDDVLKFTRGKDEPVTAGDIAEAYDIWNNKEEVDIDIVIGNEADDGDAAFALSDKRKDCISFLGVDYGIVGQKAANANTYAITHRGNRNSMFSCYTGNYVYQYDKLSVA